MFVRRKKTKISVERQALQEMRLRTRNCAGRAILHWRFPHGLWSASDENAGEGGTPAFRLPLVSWEVDVVNEISACEGALTEAFWTISKEADDDHAIMLRDVWLRLLEGRVDGIPDWLETLDFQSFPAKYNRMLFCLWVKVMLLMRKFDVVGVVVRAWFGLEGGNDDSAADIQYLRSVEIALKQSSGLDLEKSSDSVSMGRVFPLKS